jgi:hypothetical protein
MKGYVGDSKKPIVMIFISLVSIFIIAGLAGADVNNNTNGTIKFSIKSKSVGKDKNFNTDIVRINITLDRLGKLTYIENYYLEGSESLKFQSSTKYFDTILADKNISFNISRPKPGSINDRRYVFIESIILLDGKMIFNKTVNLSNRYKLDYTNMPTVKPNTTKKSPTNTTNKTAKNSINTTNKTVKSPTNTTNDSDINNTKRNIEINKTTMTEKTNGFEIIAAIIAIFILFIRLKNQK